MRPLLPPFDRCESGSTEKQTFTYEIKYPKPEHCKLRWLPVLWRFSRENSSELLEHKDKCFIQILNDLWHGVLLYTFSLENIHSRCYQLPTASH